MASEQKKFLIVLDEVSGEKYLGLFMKEDMFLLMVQNVSYVGMGMASLLGANSKHRALEGFVGGCISGPESV